MGEIVYDKPFKTYKEQIEILKNKYKSEGFKWVK